MKPTAISQQCINRLHIKRKHCSHEATEIKVHDFSIVIQGTLRKLRTVVVGSTSPTPTPYHHLSTPESFAYTCIQCVSKNTPTLTQYSSKLLGSILMKFCRNMFQFSCMFAVSSTFRLSHQTLKITRIATLYEANAATLMSFRK